MKNTSTFLKAFVCILFALAVVLFPPSASHAATAMDGAHHVGSDRAVEIDMGQTGGAVSSHAAHLKTDADSDADDDNLSSSHCCSGVCVSDALADTTADFVAHPTLGKYRTLHAQTASVEVSGFLRPPQILI